MRTGAKPWNPAVASRRRSRPISFGDFGIYDAIFCCSGVGISESRWPPSTNTPVRDWPSVASRRRRPGAWRASRALVAVPAINASDANSASNAMVSSDISVLELDHLADDQCARHLHDDRGIDETHAEFRAGQ